MILVIDNYDSFVHNLARYFRQLGQATEVVRNDQIALEDIATLRPDAIVLSPGPCAPQQAGLCLELIREFYRSIPMLGICLGHQAIAEALGAKVIRASTPVHGRASQLHHSREGLFTGLPSPMRVARYHSLVVTDIPDCLRVVAELADGTPMAIAHVDHSVFGWQFHPESVLTTHGYALLTAFLQEIGLTVSLSSDTTPIVGENDLEPDWFGRAIQFPK